MLKSIFQTQPKGGNQWSVIGFIARFAMAKLTKESERTLY